MLKYLDVARLVGAGIKCPACNGKNCRPSRWHSREESVGCKGFRPYRCEDCSNRFLVTNGAALERTLINVAAGVILGFAVLTVGEILLQNDEPNAEQLARAAAQRDAEEAEGRPTESRVETRPQTAGMSLDMKAPALAAPEIRQPVEVPAESKAESLRKAAESGQTPAMVELGRLLANGEQLPKDAVKAAKWMQLAASAGNPEGMAELGRYYRDGTGMPANPVRAYLWLDRAATAKQADALHERDALVRTMSEDKLKEAHELAITLAPEGSGERRK